MLVLLLRQTRLLRGALPREQQMRYVLAYSELLRSSHLFVLAAELMALCDDELHQELTHCTTTTAHSTKVHLSCKPSASP